MFCILSIPLWISRGFRQTAILNNSLVTVWIFFGMPSKLLIKFIRCYLIFKKTCQIYFYLYTLNISEIFVWSYVCFVEFTIPPKCASVNRRISSRLLAGSVENFPGRNNLSNSPFLTKVWSDCSWSPSRIIAVLTSVLLLFSIMSMK